VGIDTSHRLTVLREVADSIRALLDGEEISVRGVGIHLDAVALERPPAHRPRMLIGTTGPKGLAIATEAGDGALLPEGCGPAFMESIRAHFRAHADSGPPACVVYAWTRIEDDRGRLAALAAPAITHWMEGGHYPGPVATVGGPERIGDPERSSQVVGDLVIGGNADACVAAAERWFEAGATELVLATLGDDALDQVARLGAEVLPRLADPHNSR
jgi:5,10-methylenetetrahydromethanopterin reductase